MRTDPMRTDPMRTDPRPPCGGARVLDLAICMILAVTIVGLLLLAL
ncbi:hypothetical protein [Methylobacterium sp. WL6]|nr:hypothetical protein [Methylobacterium sp. WL6]